MINTLSQLGLTLDHWQHRVLTTTIDRVIVSAGCRVGKTTTAVALALNIAINEPGSPVVLISPTEAMNHLEMQMVSSYLTKLAVSVDSRQNDRFILANGSILMVRSMTDPGDLRRPRLVIVDEASRVPDETMAGIQMMGADKVVLLSTPVRSTGLFHDIWTNAPDGWHREHVPADQCPRIDPGILANARAGMRPEAYAMEWTGEFA